MGAIAIASQESGRASDRCLVGGPEARQAAAAAMPVRRIGRPEEVAAAVVWLCSEEAGCITGASLVIDGGKLADTPRFQVQLRAER